MRKLQEHAHLIQIRRKKEEVGIYLDELQDRCALSFVRTHLPDITQILLPIPAALSITIGIISTFVTSLSLLSTMKMSVLHS